MAIFKRNLTSKIIEAQTLIVLAEKKIPASILEIGCGDGNISRNLVEKFPQNKFSASDISDEAISKAQKLDNGLIDFKAGPGFDPWLNQKFDIVICDIAAISERIAVLSDWYDGVSCETGEDGLDLVKPVIQNVKNILNQNGIFIIPVISLCNVSLQMELLKTNFSSVDLTKKINWPIPEDLLLDFKKDLINFDSDFINVEKKFDKVVAYTCAATCYL